MDFRVRLYRYYYFFGYGVFNDLLHYFMLGDIRVGYSIIDDAGLISFTYNNLDYFIILTCFFNEGITSNKVALLVNELKAR